MLIPLTNVKIHSRYSNTSKMSKDNSGSGQKEEKIKLMAAPEKLIGLLIPGAKKRKWVADKLVKETSKHKQLLTGLLLQRLYKLVQNISITSGVPFVLQPGFVVVQDGEENRFSFPLPIPLLIEPGMEYKKVAKALIHLPEQEALAYAISMQVVEWVIKTTEKNLNAVLPVAAG